jgi:hypothetical protein
MLSFVQRINPKKTATLDMDATLIETHKRTALYCYDGYMQGCKFYGGSIDTITLDIDLSSSFQFTNGNTYIDTTINQVDYFPDNYAAQTNQIADTFVGCEIGVLNIHGDQTYVYLYYCKNLPNINYFDGATSAQVTIVGGPAVPALNAYMSMSTGNWTGVSFNFTGGYQELSSFSTPFTTPVYYGFYMYVDGQLSYQFDSNKTFYVSAALNVADNGNYAIAIYKNGALVPGSETYAAVYGTYSIINFPVDLVVGDYISIYAKRETTPYSATIYNVSLSVHD